MGELRGDKSGLRHRMEWPLQSHYIRAPQERFGASKRKTLSVRDTIGLEFRV
jgi:hypothetical protein